MTSDVGERGSLMRLGGDYCDQLFAHFECDLTCSNEMQSPNRCRPGRLHSSSRVLAVCGATYLV